jgi:hypothetical protein
VEWHGEHRARHLGETRNRKVVGGDSKVGTGPGQGWTFSRTATYAKRVGRVLGS